MTVFHTHPSGQHSTRGLRSGGRRTIVRASRKIVSALKAMHRAVVAAKLRRLRNELMLHRSTAEYEEFDATKFPQRPLILGDKWDF